MLSKTDIKTLTSLLATKSDVSDLREDVDGLKRTLQELTVSVDKLVGAIDNLRIEYVAIKMELDRHEKWIKQIAKKAGISLEI